MPIIVSNILIGINEEEEVAITKAIKRLNVLNENVKKSYVYKKSLDARDKVHIRFVISVMIELKNKEAEAVKSASDPFIVFKEKTPLTFVKGSEKLENPIVIVGFGPAGIFAAHILAKLGYNPIVFEKGSNIDTRKKAVNNFFENKILDTKNNVQFGEGGAGTFSDGKLTTRITDARCEYVLEQFVNNGAPEEILKTARPHIGTDKLSGVIKSLRKEIISLGGGIYFNKSLEDIIIKNNSICGIVVDGETIETNNVILATGHSSRDIFEMLFKKEVSIESKDFSVGVRIEQLKSTINKGLYGKFADNKNIPEGEYQLSHKLNGKCVYTFCMCPGGIVVPAASSENSVVTNGMSFHARDGENSNSALVVSVDKNDYGNKPLDGMIYQQALEKAAFIAGGSNYSAPAVTVGDFLEKRVSLNINTVKPTFANGVIASDFDKIFSDNISKMLRVGLRCFDAKLKGFADKDGILTGVETRTSSPVRILRNANFSSINVNGLYPCGEGAGYAGGIISAAVDGIKVACEIASKYKAND